MSDLYPVKKKEEVAAEIYSLELAKTSEYIICVSYIFYKNLMLCCISSVNYQCIILVKVLDISMNVC